MLLLEILIWISIFLIFYSFIGYPFSLFILNKLIKEKKNKVDINLRPSVSIIIPAHNEEKIIARKLENLINLNYPKDLIEIIIASDNSTDKTNEIVERFIKETNNCNNVILYKVNKRKGKTNAQNEAVKIAKGEILVFSDANAMLDKDSIIHIVSSFTSDDIIYVTGRLKYVNSLDAMSSDTESNYWNYDLFMRKVESDIKTITAGNGALYAIRKSEYIEFDPIRSHDSAMPLEAAINKKRALYNEKAIAYEKAGQTSDDEFKRKVRMFRGILRGIFAYPQKHNVFKFGWASYFFFCHRTLRNSLFILHITLILLNILLVGSGYVYIVLFILQFTFYLIAVWGKFYNYKRKIFYYPYYYCMTLLAQLLGAVNQLTGRSKSFWEKAETTR